MKRINLFYYNHYKRRYGYTGHFWQDRFRSLLIEKNEYLLACGLYIERNPVKAKIVNTAEQYPHSSYKYYAYGKSDNLTDTDIYYGEIGSNAQQRQKEYRRLLLDEEKNIDKSVFTQMFLGTKEFIKQMEDKFKVTNMRLNRGRPKRIK